MTLYRNNNRGVPNDCLFPIKIDVVDEATFREATIYDNTFATFESNYRTGVNWRSSNVLFADFDNAGIPDEEWDTIERLMDNFKGFNYYIITSKSHMKGKTGAKGSETPRPKYHVYFPVEDIYDPELYRKYLRALRDAFPKLHFDESVKDVARHFSATVKEAEVYISSSGVSITSHLDLYLKVDEQYSAVGASVPVIGGNSPFDEEVFRGLGPGQEGHGKLLSAAVSMQVRGFDDAEIRTKILYLNSLMITPRPIREVDSILGFALKRQKGTKFENRPIMERAALVDLGAGVPDKEADPWGYVAYWCAYFDKKYAWVAFGKDGKIVCRDDDGGANTPPRHPKAFIESALPRGRDCIEYAVKDGKTKEDKPKELHIPTYWVKNTTHYKGIQFAPGIEGDIVDGPESVLNTFTGFKYTRKDIDGCSKAVEMFLTHLKDNVCSGDEGLFEYLNAWFADIIQHPGKPNGIAVALQGDNGAGKSVCFEVLQKMLGKYVYTFERLESVTKEFNSAVAGKLLCYVDDSGTVSKRTNLDVLKTYITSEVISIERKGVDRYLESNFARFAVTSNAIDVIRLDENDRRWLVIDMGDLQEHEKGVRDQFLRELKDLFYKGSDVDLMERNLSALYWYWKNLDISKINWRNIPETEARRNAQMGGQPVEVQFVISCAVGAVDSSLNIFTDIEYNGGVLVADFKKKLRDWMELHGRKDVMPDRMKRVFEKYFKKAFSSKKNARGDQEYYFEKAIISYLGWEN